MDVKEAIFKACHEAAVKIRPDQLKDLSWFYRKSLKKRS